MIPSAMWPDESEEQQDQDPETDKQAKERLKSSIEFLKEL